MTRLVTTYLEMRSRQELRPGRVQPAGVRLVRVARPAPEFAHFLYRAVGGDWSWTDRLGWTRAQWHERLGRDGVETWVALLDGAPAGYFELERDPQGSVEIVSFGVLPDCSGRGLGGWLLTCAIERAWEAGAARVWLHTCNLDHPAAIPNYEARGLRIYDVQEEERPLPAPAPYWVEGD